MHDFTIDKQECLLDMKSGNPILKFNRKHNFCWNWVYFDSMSESDPQI